jgi:poly(A) polymerase
MTSREPFIFNPETAIEATEPHPEYKLGTTIVEALFNNGHEAYFVGGYCRDLMLGLKPKDIDIAASAQGEVVEQILREAGIEVAVVAAAEAYPVVVAKLGHSQIEIATFRKDVYEDTTDTSRRPDQMLPGTLLDDAERRDLTINSLYFNPLTSEMHDPTGYAISDLESKTIRFIGDAIERILQDRVRILRAVRFKHRFGFEFDPQTKQALIDLRQELFNIKGKDRIGVGSNWLFEHPY